MPRERTIQTHIPELDDALGGGFSKGCALGIFGSLGTGKTTLALQIAYNNISRGKTCSYHTHDQSADLLIEMMKNHGWDPEPYEENFHILDFYMDLAPSEDELDTLPSMSLEEDLAKKLDHRLLLLRSSQEMRKKFGGKLPDLFIVDSATPLYIQLGGNSLYMLFRMAKQLFLRNTASIATIQSDTVSEKDRNALSSLAEYKLVIEQRDRDSYNMNIEKSLSEITKPRLSYELTRKGITFLPDQEAVIEVTSAPTASSDVCIEHSQIKGRQVLFEFDPLTRYDICIKDLCTGATANDEVAVIFTRRASPVYRTLYGSENIHLRSSTGRTIRSPLLDDHPDEDVFLVLDGITERIILEGLEPTFNYVKNTIERLSENDITALFLINPQAHSPREISTIRGLFSNHLAHDKEGLKKIRLS